jgi:hypothetical protein
MGNPLGQMQKLRDAATVKGKPVTVVELGDYEAFKPVSSRQIRLQLRPRGHAWERATYSQLLRIVEDGISGDQIALVYTMMVVLITGKNLQPVTDAIDSEQCVVVWEFDSGRWNKPKDDSLPFVEKIEFFVERATEALEKVKGYRALSTNMD